MKAFPFKDHIQGQYGQSDGMDLRDYFADKAMESMILRAIDEEVMPDELAINSYFFADAMMKARTK